jgi:hypothetical protein
LCGFTQPLSHQIEHRASLAGINLLIQFCCHQALLPLDFTGIGHDIACNDLHQGGFTHAVSAEQADTFTGIDGQTDVLQDSGAAETDADIT